MTLKFSPGMVTNESANPRSEQHGQPVYAYIGRAKKSFTFPVLTDTSQDDESDNPHYDGQAGCLVIFL